jgi:hypothetical protein
MPFSLFSQSFLSGIVRDKSKAEILGANIYFKSVPNKGTTTDFNGEFSIKIDDNSKVLVISFIGYQAKEILLSSIDMNEKLLVVLQENTENLDEVIVAARDPISEKFSVVRMHKLEIYLNPLSQGDPLKAITAIPASTNTDETANPSLRGSSSGRSRVILNGVPVYNPVRASQLNNQGFFSLFNPEIIERQYVYASNPPLTYGNTSAGLVDIQTINSLESNQLQLSSSLANEGLMLLHSFRKDTSFIQIYGNYQFSDAYISLQKKSLPNVKSFTTKDMGVNFHTKIGRSVEFNSFNYLIDEEFDGIYKTTFYNNDIATKNKRFFSVNNLKLYTRKGTFSLNSGFNTEKQNFMSGNMKSDNSTKQIFTSLNFKSPLSEMFNYQFGVSHDYQINKFVSKVPVNYYDVSEKSPTYDKNTDIENNIIETYAYVSFDINELLSVSSGIRSCIPVNDQDYYLSSQLSLKFNIDNRQNLLLSGGRYYNYSIPNYFSQKYSLLSSKQVAMDYTYDNSTMLAKAALYYKQEKGDLTNELYLNIDKTETFGAEIYLEQYFCNFFKFTFANSFIKQRITIDKKEYKGSNDFKYFIKTSIQYNNPALFSLSAMFTTRPGTYYTPVVGSILDSKVGVFKPIISDDLYSSQYDAYARFDISLSKYIHFKENAFIVFATLNNVINAKNEKTILYNSSYTKSDFSYFQLRTIYFGVILHLNY